ncbi:hypothetical protein Baya_13027 [Bagarius yarrelli]|uniref:Secreted protein n=1 Tax=Bagarius yarrelli TaxID=175774 RepID=A0A556V4Y5_BAGYA|nr:hypothetical protein Baya_13027 [Bagarius yarrelli]
MLFREFIRALLHKSVSVKECGGLSHSRTSNSLLLFLLFLFPLLPRPLACTSPTKSKQEVDLATSFFIATVTRDPYGEHLRHRRTSLGLLFGMMNLRLLSPHRRLMRRVISVTALLGSRRRRRTDG